MTKEQLLRFIDNNYADGEEIVWQTVSQGDVGASDADWVNFVAHTEESSELADTLSGVVLDAFTEWLDTDGEDEDE
jgi:hypothetical protein